MRNRYLTAPIVVVLLTVMGIPLIHGKESAKKSIKVFVLAGDEYVLEHGLVEGRTNGEHGDFYPNAKPTRSEKWKHVTASVYAGAYSPDTDYDRQKALAAAEVEIGYQRTRRSHPKKRGRVNVPMAPFPAPAFKAGHTTVLRGCFSVTFKGRYELHPGDGDSAFNITTVDGKEVYRRDAGQAEARITAIELHPKKRYAFKTVFLGKPGHAFRIPLINKPGTLTTAVEENARHAFLRGKDGKWVIRDDVVLYDAHAIHNNTEAPARPIQASVRGRDGPESANVMGVNLMLGHQLGQAVDHPVMIIRYGTRHPIWFRRGSRDLSHDYRPPSSGGGSDLNGSWDVIHFNHGVWDAIYREASSKYFSGHNITSVKDFEKNLRTLVGKMKKTGAALIWATVTPVWKGDEGKRNADVNAFNKVAERVMKENGVIINDLNAEVRRQGYPKGDDVHSVGNLEPKVTKTILDALARRNNKTRPLPRVLFIGDSITGSYWAKAQKSLDGKAVVFKNPGNAEDTWNGLERMDEWLDLKRYLLNGQEYLGLVDGVKKVMGDELKRAYPGYAGQKAELAGLIWFQGEADGKWNSKAAAYEKHLANLIRDLRKDWRAPKLPVVVAALANAGGKMTANQQKVFDAQMAVGNKDKYPEFAGNVISIDTRPMCRPLSASPGGRDRFKGNAASYLDIGEAMGQAMLQLLKDDK